MVERNFFCTENSQKLETLRTGIFTSSSAAACLSLLMLLNAHNADADTH